MPTDGHNIEKSYTIEGMDATDLHTRLSAIDERQRKDHDTLIRMDTKTDQILTNIESLRDGFNKRLLDVEARVKYFSDLEIELNPRDMKKKLEDVVDWKDKFGFTWKVVVFTSSTISAVIGFILAVVSQVSNFFPKN